MADIGRAIDRFREATEPRRRVWRGWMIDFEGIGSARVSEEPGYVYVRIDRGLSGEASGEIIKAFARIRPVVGWAVIVGTTPFRDWEYTVLDLDTEAMGGQSDGDPILEPHHLTHEWGEPSGSDDVVYVREIQVYDFGVWPYSGLQVKVNAGLFDPTGTTQRLDDTVVDLTSYVPSWGQIYCLLALSPTGTIEVVPGQRKGSLTYQDIPPAPSVDHWELAAIRLRAGDTEIIHTPTNKNIVDLRFSRHGWAGKLYSGHDPVTLSTQADANLLHLNAQEIGLDAQPSGTVFAAPTGGDGYPSFRFLADSDVPDIHTHYPGSIPSDALADPDVAWENVITVAQSGGDHTTIGGALGAAASGDVILIMPGTYSEDVSMVADVTLVGLSREECIVQGYIHLVNNSAAENLTVSISDSGAQSGITVAASATATLYNVHVVVNSTDSTAYGLNVNNGSATVSAYRCRFVGTGSTGYGVYINSTTSTINLYHSISEGSTTYDVIRDTGGGGGGSVNLFQTYYETYSGESVFKDERVAEQITVHGDDGVYLTTTTAEKGLRIGTSVFVGNWTGGAGNLAVSHWNVKATSGSYALLQDSSGGTRLNAATGQNVSLRVNNSEEAYLSASNLIVSAVGLQMWNSNNVFIYSGAGTGAKAAIFGASGDFRTAGGIFVGSTGTDPADGEIQATVHTSGLVNLCTYEALPGAGISTSGTIPFAGAIRRAVTVKEYVVSFYVATTNDFTHYWNINFQNAAASTKRSINTSTASADTWTRKSSGTVTDSWTTSDIHMRVEVTKTGTPGALYITGPAVYAY